MFEKQTGATGNADSSTALILPSETPPAAAQRISAEQGEERFPHSQHITDFLPRFLFANKKFSKWG